jgi:hypothetical protein
VPLCPSHMAAADVCPGGALWHCGAIKCPTHLGSVDRCLNRLRLCGKVGCPTHARFIDRCVAGADCLPIYAFLAPPDQVNGILDLLRSPLAHQVDFTLGAFAVHGADYSRIADAITKCQILVMPTALSIDGFGSERLAGSHAAYDSTSDLVKRLGTKILYSGNGASLTVERKALLLHECTHALNDHYRRSFSGLEDEKLAAVAQMLYLALGDPNYRTASRRISPFQHSCALTHVACATATLGTALLIAQEIQAGRQPSAALIAGLAQGLQNDPDYIGRLGPRQYTGFGF